MQVTFQGDPIEVKGSQPKVGEQAPDATLTTRQGDQVKLSSYFGEKPVVLSVVPDVETRTCELQTKRFAKELADQDVTFLTISRNTIDEFNTWNKENELDLVTLSDTDKEFGEAYGLAVDMGEEELLARSVFLVDQSGTIQYVQVVPEIADEPNYQETLKAIQSL